MRYVNSIPKCRGPCNHPRGGFAAGARKRGRCAIIPGDAQVPAHPPRAPDRAARPGGGGSAHTRARMADDPPGRRQLRPLRGRNLAARRHPAARERTPRARVRRGRSDGFRPPGPPLPRRRQVVLHPGHVGRRHDQKALPRRPQGVRQALQPARRPALVDGRRLDAPAPPRPSSASRRVSGSATGTPAAPSRPRGTTPARPRSSSRNSASRRRASSCTGASP